MSSDPLAGDLLSVELIGPDTATVVTLRRTLVATVRDWMLGWFSLDTVKTDSYLVRLKERRSERTILEYDHDDGFAAHEHLRSLEDRLARMNYWDFCREVGVDYDEAVRLRGQLNAE